MMSTLLKLGSSGYDVKQRLLMRILVSPTKSTFFRKNFGGTRHLCKKNKPILERFGGGVHCKSCWLIAYRSLCTICLFIYYLHYVSYTTVDWIWDGSSLAHLHQDCFILNSGQIIAPLTYSGNVPVHNGLLTNAVIRRKSLYIHLLITILK